LKSLSIPQDDRLADIRPISAVAKAVALAAPAEQFISRLKPEIVVKGLEYAGRINLEQSVIDG
jgi:hypothetical protein